MRKRDLVNRLGISLGRNTTANPSRKSSEAIQLVTNNAAGAYTTVTAGFECRTPSTRLSGCIFIGNDQGVALPASGSTAWTVALTAWAQTKDGVWVPGNVIETGVVLPSFYEFATMAPSIKGVVTVPNAPGTGIDPTNLWAWAEWEPAPGDNIDPEELTQLLGACSFTGLSITTSKTGA
jgi:hypothetical protein